MVELSSSGDLYQHGFPNIVFVLPAIVVVGLSVFFGYKLYLSLTEKERKLQEKQKAKQSKKKK
ncbi:AAEL001767-PC [Aedes aegypti]|uniref:AAEL001767-PA n=2 Tax=Aedes aegypti TaxID=7159 RepID=A6KV16_AEDAE|nr:signal anchor-containing conserved peptide [Aedes aegypti]EAT47109.1 AAEL001767-PA [Aedes aegypti]EAT47110.1 AAEL001767-PC [Aedes aegypti]